MVEKAALRGRFGHLCGQIFRHIEIAVTLPADELDVQPVFGGVIVKFANGCRWHGLCNDRWLKMFHVRAVVWFRSRAVVLSRRPSGKLGAREASSSAIDRDASVRWHDEMRRVGWRSKLAVTRESSLPRNCHSDRAQPID